MSRMPRVRSTAVAGSPAAAAETVIAAIPPASIPVGNLGDPVDIICDVDIIAGTSGTAVTLKIERGTVAGGPTVLATRGPVTVVATQRYSLTIQATDNETGQGYVLTATVTSGAAVSTVNNVSMRADW